MYFLGINLCKYENIFGEPHKGVHSYRIFGFAAIDLFFTILGAYLIAYFSRISFWKIFFILILLSVFFHKAFCVHSTLTEMVFGK